MITWTICVLAVILATACGTDTAPAVEQAKAERTVAQSPVERGKYLVTIVGCNDCHTTKNMGPKGPEPDMSRMLAGHPENMKMPPAPRLAATSPWNVAASATLTAWSGPWGVSFATNLTPDRNTGLGNWTEQMFITAMRTGKHMGTSRQILPPMPWQDIAEMSDADLKAIYAYLRTIPSVTNHVPDPIPPSATK